MPPCRTSHAAARQPQKRTQTAQAMEGTRGCVPGPRTVRDGVERHAPLKRRQLLQACTHAAMEHGALRKAHRPQEGGRAVKDGAVCADGEVAQRDARLPRRAGGLRAQADLRDVRCARRRAVSPARAERSGLGVGMRS